MSIKLLQCCEPFFTIKALSDEKEYQIYDKSVVVNLSKEYPVMVMNKPVHYLKSAIITNVVVYNLQQALIVENYERYEDEELLFEKIKKTWPIYYDMTKEPRHKGLKVWRSPKEQAFPNININLCGIAAHTATGPHKNHCGNFTEVHTQLVGYGKMQKFTENDCSTLYQEVTLAPGFTHDPFFDKNVVYPWHQYQSITDAVYMPIEISWEIKEVNLKINHQDKLT